MDYHKPNPETQEKPRRILAPRKPAGRQRGFYSIASASAVMLSLCLLACPGCSSDKRQVEHVALQFVESIKTGDVETLERIMDWERWYLVASQGVAPKAGAGNSEDKGQKAGDRMREIIKRTGQDEDMPEGFREQKGMLLTVLSTDKVLSLRYRTAEHAIKRVSINGPEARAEISQEDRATGEKRRITLQLHKDPDAGWRIYKFLSEELKET